MVKTLTRFIYSFWLLTFLYACSFNEPELVMMAPFQIVSAIKQGASGLPYLYYSNTDLKRLDEACKLIPTRVTINDTYLSAYGIKLADVLPEGETGQKFHDMREASQYFQKTLKDKGVLNPEDYIFTSINTAQKKGYVLFAVVKRSKRAITVVDKYNNKTIGPEDLAFYQPFQHDIHGNNLDTIVDWAGYPNDCISKQSSQAVLITITANEVMDNALKQGFWDAEKRWVKGDYKKVMKEQDKKTCIACGFTKGFFED
jgi:hypothetical protein